MLKLYDFAKSPRVKKVRIVLAEKDLEYEKIPIDLMKGEHKKPGFLAVNPRGQVPVLKDQNAIIYESAIIIEYLEDKFPQPSLLPSSPEKRAQVRMLMHSANHSYDQALMQIVIEKLFKLNGQEDDSIIAKSSEIINSYFAELEKELKNKEYLAGEFSLADICFGCWEMMFSELAIEIPQDFPNVIKWFARIKQRPSFKEIIT